MIGIEVIGLPAFRAAKPIVVVPSAYLALLGYRLGDVRMMSG
jgi:hypothetical protein